MTEVSWDDLIRFGKMLNSLAGLVNLKRLLGIHVSQWFSPSALSLIFP
jgi:hypothetical protein